MNVVAINIIISIFYNAPISSEPQMYNWCDEMKIYPNEYDEILTCLQKTVELREATRHCETHRHNLFKVDLWSHIIVLGCKRCLSYYINVISYAWLGIRKSQVASCQACGPGGISQPVYADLQLNSHDDRMDVLHYYIKRTCGNSKNASAILRNKLLVVVVVRQHCARPNSCTGTRRQRNDL